MDPWIGRTLSRVEIREHLGQGGMAEVFVGHHTTLNRPVAVKIVHAHIAENEPLLERFTAEARAVAGMRHPNIVQVFDFDVVDGYPYIVMELLQGVSLRDHLEAATEPLALDAVVRIVHELGSALDYAHRNGIVHRDVKPANIMLRRDAGDVTASEPLAADVEAVLTDFGIARIPDAIGQTATGSILGTPAYMSPEQVQGEAVDARSDIYSLGVVLYELLSGEVPFVGETQASVMIKHINETPERVSAAPPAVQAVLDRSLAKSKDDRFQSAGEMATALEQAVAISRGADPNETVVSTGSAVTDRSPRAQASDKTIGTDPTESSPTSDDAQQRPSRAARAGVISAIAAVVLAAVLWMAVSSGGGDTEVDAVGATTTAASVPSTSDAPGSGESASSTAAPLPTTAPIPATTQVAAVQVEPAGIVRFGDHSLSVEMTETQVGPAGTHLVAWLDGDDDSPVRLGDIAGGTSPTSFSIPDGRLILLDHSMMLISAEPEGDDDTSLDGIVVFVAEVDVETLAAIRSTQDPASSGDDLRATLGPALIVQAMTHDEHLGFVVDAIASNDLVAMKLHAEHIINLSVGERSPDYLDWDGSGRVENPGDAVGLIPYLTVIGSVIDSQTAALGFQGTETTEVTAASQPVENLMQMVQNNVDVGMRLSSADSVSGSVLDSGSNLTSQLLADGVSDLVTMLAGVEFTIDATLLRVTS